MNGFGSVTSDGMAISAEGLGRLVRGGWDVFASCKVGQDGGHLWVVTGLVGRTMIRVEGRTRHQAWADAVAEAGLLGMLGRDGTPEQG